MEALALVGWSPQFLGICLDGKIWWQCVAEKNVNFNTGRSRRKRRGKERRGREIERNRETERRERQNTRDREADKELILGKERVQQIEKSGWEGSGGRCACEQ